MQGRSKARRLVLPVLFLVLAAHGGETPVRGANPEAKWSGDLLVIKYKNREFILGTRNAGAKEFPLVGTRTLAKPVYANAAFPMTIQEQQSYVIYDRTQSKYIVYNIARCLKDKDEVTHEKTDWVGTIMPAGKNWLGDIIVVRKYEKKGGTMRAPYYSMGREYPMILDADGTCRVQYSYFGEVVLKSTASTVSSDLLPRMIDDFDGHYSLRDDMAP